MCLGIPARIIAITDTRRHLARVDVAGVQREVNITCVLGEDQTAEACVGQWVLIHAGFAMSRVDEGEARKTLTLLAELETANPSGRQSDT